MMGKAVQFRQRQRIHVGPQADRPLAAAQREPGHHPGAGDAAMHFEAEAIEIGRHFLRGALLVESQFGMGVYVAAEGGDLRRQGRQQFVDHGSVRSGNTDSDNPSRKKAVKREK
jgi:hypothetical protein